MIQVYRAGNGNYEMNGDSVLFPERCVLKAVLNGSWELEMTYPVGKDGRWKYTEGESVIAAPTFMGEKQLFRTNTCIKEDREIVCTAYPVFFDSADDCFLKDVRAVAKNGQEALDIMTAGTAYSGTSDIMAASTCYFVRRNLMAAINGDEENTFVKRWGGEILYDNYRVIINERAGGDYGAEVRYGKNMDGISYRMDMSDTVTRIVPVAYNGYTIGGSSGHVDSPLIGKYAKVYTAEMKFDDVKMAADVMEGDVENGVTVCGSQEEMDRVLAAKCREQFENGADLPKVTIDVDMVLLENTEEYRDIKMLESVGLGDTVKCIHSVLGIETQARVTELEWDCIRNRPVSVRLGDFGNDYFSELASVIEAVKSVMGPGNVLMAERISGIMNMMDTQLRYQKSVAQRQDVRAVLFEDLDPDSPLYGAMCLGTQGFQIADSRTADGKDWDWKTAFTAKGGYADTLIAGILSDRKGKNFWNLDTGEFRLSSDTAVEGGTTVGEIAADAAEALKKAEQAHNLTLVLDNEYQGIPADHTGSIENFPSVQTTAQVFYGHGDVSSKCTYSIKENGISGMWDIKTRTYTVAGITGDTGWVEITAVYLGTFSVTKRFNVAKIKDGTPGTDGKNGTDGKDGTDGKNGADGKNGTDGVGVKSSAVTYQAGTSGTAVPTGAWQSDVPSVSANQYLWTKTVLTYTDGTDTTMYSVGKMGATGAAGRNGTDGVGIRSITEHYAVSASNSTAPVSWQTSVPDMTATNRYLWNYETVTYTNNTTSDTAKRVIGVYGDKGDKGATGATGATGKTGAAGKGIKSVTNYYLATASASGVTTGTSGWTTTVQNVSATKKYLWNYEVITYTDNTTASTAPCVIGAYGDKGATGATGADGRNGTDGVGIKSTVITYQKSSGGTTIPTGTWSSGIPATSAGEYLWTRTVVTYTDNTTASSYSVSRNGSNGAAGRVYGLGYSTNVIKQGKDGELSPGYIDFDAYYRNGTSATRTAYKGRFKIEESTDGSTWTTMYTSAANESSVRWSLYTFLTDDSGNALADDDGYGIAATRNFAMVKCTLYAAGGTTTMLDTQTIVKVIDAEALTHEEIFNLLTNNGAVKGIYMENGQLYISFSYAKGGELTLGGADNAYGKLKILDESGKQIGNWDKDGLEFSKTIGSWIFNSLIGSVTTWYYQNEINRGGFMVASDFSGNADGRSEIILSPAPRLNSSSYTDKAYNILSSNRDFLIESKKGSSDLWSAIRLGDNGNASGDVYLIAGNNNTAIYAVGVERLASGGVTVRLYSSGDGTIDLTSTKYIRLNGKTVVQSVYFDTNLTAPYMQKYSSAVRINGNFEVVNGSKSKVAVTENYGERLLYCYEMPSPMFGDTGEAEIDENGECYIYLDDVFSETVTANIEYQVFLQKEGPGDLWIAEKNPVYFIVKGTENLKFAWEIKAKQRGYECERLENTEPENEPEETDYEEEYMKEISRLMAEQEEIYYETVKQLHGD